jgi:hypothetical protein
VGGWCAIRLHNPKKRLMKTFLLVSKQIDGEGVFFGYNEDGLLVRFEIKGKATPVQIKYLQQWMPRTIADFETFKHIVENNGSKSKMIEVQTDLSFERFWEEYNYKVGKKPRAKNLWEAMDDADRARALAYIKRYNQYLSQHPGQDRQHPTTFLSYRQWDN